MVGIQYFSCSPPPVFGPASRLITLTLPDKLEQNVVGGNLPLVVKGKL